MAVPNVTVARSSQLVKPVPLLEGTRTDPAGKAVRNVILLSVPDDEYEMIRPHLELLEPPRHFVMHEQGEKLDFAYFPMRGWSRWSYWSRMARVSRSDWSEKK